MLREIKEELYGLNANITLIADVLYGMCLAMFVNFNN